MFCQKCGKEIDDAAVVCPNCGVPTENYHKEQQQPNVVINNSNSNVNSVDGLVSPKSRMVTFLLALFLGELGIHRFYVGKIGTGILWLCTLGVFGIGWLVDTIMAGVGAFRDSYGRPIKNW